MKSISINTPSVWPSISVQLQWTVQPTRKWYIKKNKADSACTSLYSRLLFYCKRQFVCYIKLKPQHTCPNCIHHSVHREKHMVVLTTSMWILTIFYRYSNIVTTDWLVGSLYNWYYRMLADYISSKKNLQVIHGMQCHWYAWLCW